MPDRLLKIPAILERGVSNVASVFDAFGVGIYCVDLDGRFTYINPAGAMLLGWCGEELLGQVSHDVVHHSHPDGSPFPRDECLVHRAFELGRAGQEFEELFWRKDGAPLEVALTIAPLYDDDEHIGTIVVFVDVHERRRDAEMLRTRAAQQAALAELGLLALSAPTLQPLLERATTLVARTLDVDVAGALELDADAGCLRLRAGVGFRAGQVGTAIVETGYGSPAGLAAAHDEPVVVEDLRTERRFRPPQLMVEHGVISALDVVIHTRNDVEGTVPWGVLGAGTSSRRTFAAQDVDFSQGVANTLGLAIERYDAEEELRRRNREITELAEQVSKLADNRRRIIADALDADDRTREQISQLLHDEVLQSLLSARQDVAKLVTAGSGHDELAAQAHEAIVVAIGELRHAVVALHPVTLKHGGLSSALRAIAELYAGRGGFEVTVQVDPQAGGARDQLIVSLAQELLSNIVQHAEARQVTVAVRRTRHDVVLEVSDDGRGMSAAQSRQALERGHVGLASAAMRTESLGGSFELASSRGGGTRVRAVIPVGSSDAHR